MKSVPMHLSSQEIETFQNLGENSLFLLHRKRAWRTLLMMLALVKWLKCPPQADSSKAEQNVPWIFFLTLVSLVVGLELNPFLSNLPLCQKLPLETPNTHPKSKDTTRRLAIHCLCMVGMVVWAHKGFHIWPGWERGSSRVHGCRAP